MKIIITNLLVYMEKVKNFEDYLILKGKEKKTNLYDH